MLIRATALAFLILSAAFGSAFAQSEPYVRADQVDLTHILAPAPAQDSAITREDVRILLDLQAARTPELVALANADVERTLSRFSDAMGTDLSKERAPLANALVDKAAKDANIIVHKAKDHWARVRPFLAFSQIKLVLPREESAAYPSGHATWGMMTAIILANMVPEKARVLYDRGIAFGFSRLIGGVHYPSDVEAGRISGSVVTAMMENDAGFKADFAKAAAEVRGLLGLPLTAGAAPVAASAAVKPEPVPAK